MSYTSSKKNTNIGGKKIRDLEYNGSPKNPGSPMKIQKIPGVP